VISNQADVDPNARIADDVTIGPWTVIGRDVEIGLGSWIGPHVVIQGPTRIGKNNRIYQFSSIGEAAQHLNPGENARLEIGDGNVIREYCTLNRGTEEGGGVTRVGNDNMFLAYIHIAHDCIVGNNTIFTNYSAISGHVTVGNYVTIGGYSGVHQNCTLGDHCFVGGATMIGKDVLPYITASGHPSTVAGLNSIGLRRRGFSTEVIQHLRRAYKIIFRQGLTVKQAIVDLQEILPECSEVGALIDSLENTERGILR